jgi:uncharacterized membrane protein YeaQ/YmgE (transglycosylase-associated protein family)
MDRDNVVVYTAWPVSWSGIWVGTLAALAVGLIIGLIGTAVGAHEASRYVDWKKVRLIGLVFSVAGAFFAFVVGGWVAARIAGITRAETAILHGAIVWLPGAYPCCSSSPPSAWPGSSAAGTGGLSGVPAWAAAVPSADPEIARMMRNTAVATVVALLVGLIGSVIGGWMASGEPMTLTYYRSREIVPRRVPAKI